MKLKRRRRNARPAQGASTPLVELFEWYAFPPSPLHETIQLAAKQAGWIPPWDREERQTQTKTAGQKSGSMRAGRAEIRRYFVKVAFERLKPANQMQPYSDHSLDALEVEYRRLLAEDGLVPDELMSRAPFKADRETLIKDLKQLGIRSQLRKRRSG
jgi:hypothetical protein